MRGAPLPTQVCAPRQAHSCLHTAGAGTAAHSNTLCASLTCHRPPAPDVRGGAPGPGLPSREEGRCCKTKGNRDQDWVSLSPKPTSLFPSKTLPNLEQPHLRGQAGQWWTLQGGAQVPVPCQPLGMWPAGPSPQTALFQGEKAGPHLLTTPENSRTSQVGAPWVSKGFAETAGQPALLCPRAPLRAGPHRPSPVRARVPSFPCCYFCCKDWQCSLSRRILSAEP